MMVRSWLQPRSPCSVSRSLRERSLAMDVPHQVVTVILSAAAGVLAWLATNWVGKPIVDARDKRLKALQPPSKTHSLVAGRVTSVAAQPEPRSTRRRVPCGPFHAVNGKFGCIVGSRGTTWKQPQPHLFTSTT